MFAKLYIILVNLYMKRDFIVGVTFCFTEKFGQKKGPNSRRQHLNSKISRIGLFMLI